MSNAEEILKDKIKELERELAGSSWAKKQAIDALKMTTGEARSAELMRDQMDWYEEYVDYVSQNHPQVHEFAAERVGEFPKEV